MIFLHANFYIILFCQCSRMSFQINFYNLFESVLKRAIVIFEGAVNKNFVISLRITNGFYIL